MWLYVVLLEVGIVAGSGLDSWAKGDDTTWFRRWLYWHLRPLWALALTGARGLERLAQKSAALAVERHRRIEARVILVDPTAD